MNKKPVFDAVRAMLGRGFTQAEVAVLDRAFDAALVLQDIGPAPDGYCLGALSEHFESGGRGAGAVSGGAGDPGGVSYGIWQLSSRTGTAAAFMANEGARWAAGFAGARPGTPAFGAAWQAAARRDGAAFAGAQHAFIARSHYRPAVAAVLRAHGLDLDARHRAVRDAVWSVAVQHGGAARILGAAVAMADARPGRADPAYDRALVEAIYAERSAYVLRLADRAGAASAEGRLLRSIARNRYPAERAAALAMFESAASA